MNLLSNRKRLLEHEQVKLLYAAIPLSCVANLVNATVLVSVMWRQVGHGVLLSWFVCLVSLALLRLGMFFAYRKRQPENQEVWGRAFTLSVLAAGALWGSTALLIFPMDSIGHQVFLAFIVGGLSAGAISTLSPQRLPVFSFILLVLGPLILRLFVSDGEMSAQMSGMLVIFLTIVMVSANRSYLNIRENIESRLQSLEGLGALAESEQRFRDLFEGNKSVQLILDPRSGRILEANHAAAAFYGYSRNELIHMKITDINTMNPEQVQAEMERARREERGHFYFRHRLAGGEVRDVEVHSGPISWNGQAVLYSIVHDISERVWAEQLMHKTSRILEMVAAGSQAQKIFDAICHMNESMHPGVRTSILRLKGDQLFHCSAPSLPEDYCRAIDGVRIGPKVGSCGTAAFEGRNVIVEDIATDPLWSDFRDVALPHNLRACWSSPVRSSDGRIMGTVAMYFDQVMRPTGEDIEALRSISRLVAIVMEREARESLLLKLSQAIEQAGESVLITDRLGDIEYVNPSFTRITGYMAEEVMGKNPRMLKSGNQSDAYYRRMWETLTSGRIWQSAIIDRRKDGSEYPALMTISPIRDSSGEISHYVGLQQDMTDHEMLEEKFRQAQKMEALGTQVGGIAHDFNNMLAGMTGNLYLARKKLADRPEVASKLDTVEALSFRASDMIKQLLTFARKSHVEMKPFGLTSFLREATKLSKASIPENIRLVCDFCDLELVIRGDATQLQQVVMNLLNNARDAVRDAAEPTITLRLEEFSGDDALVEAHPGLSNHLLAHLVIEDNGSGIRESDRAHIFEPFYTTKEVGHGTGLGLAMAYGAIHSHGGVIEVDSEPGRGTAFHLYIPLLEDVGLDEQAESQVELCPGHGELILIVDDNADVRRTGREVLEEIGYRVLEATDGIEAIEVFEQRHDEIALVLLDVVMPRLGGVAAAERIRQIDPAARIMFATGYDRDATLQNEMPPEEFEVLSKPYNVEQLSQAIDRQLGGG